MTTTTNEETQYFTPTGAGVILDALQPGPRPVYRPSAQVCAWDHAGAGTNCTVYSERHDVHCFAELKVTGRSARKHADFGGIVGWRGRVRFTSAESPDRDWHPCVVWLPEGAQSFEDCL